MVVYTVANKANPHLTVFYIKYSYTPDVVVLVLENISSLVLLRGRWDFPLSYLSFEMVWVVYGQSHPSSYAPGFS